MCVFVGPLKTHIYVIAVKTCFLQLELFLLVWELTTRKSFLCLSMICLKSCCQWEVNILLLQMMIWSQVHVLSCFLSGQPNNLLGNSLSHCSGLFLARTKKNLVFLKLDALALWKLVWGNMLCWGYHSRKYLDWDALPSLTVLSLFPKLGASASWVVCVCHSFCILTRIDGFSSLLYYSHNFQ